MGDMGDMDTQESDWPWLESDILPASLTPRGFGNSRYYTKFKSQILYEM
jgi:hypothetical protein